MNRRALLVGGYRLADIANMVMTLAFAAWVVAQEDTFGSFGSLLAVRLKVVNVLLMAGVFALWYFVFKAFDLYGSHRLSSPWVEVGNVLKATTVCACTLLSAGFLFKIELITPLFISVFWASSSLAVATTRILLRRVLVSARLRGRNLRYVAIVGTNERALRFAERIRNRPELGYELLGFVDDEWSGLGSFRHSGERLLAGFKEFRSFLRTTVVDEIVVALPMSSSYERMAQIVRFCEEQGVTVRLVQDMFNVQLATSRVEMFQDEPVLTWQTHRFEMESVLAKRVLDLILASTLLLILLPLLLVVVLLVKFSSPGPMFFVQPRIGLNKRVFPLMKFRTMCKDAETQLAGIEHLNEVSGPVFKVEKDPRVTPLGSILRKTSIDELPQLLNVVKGDMSLVGPRPLPVRDYEGFDTDWHRRRFSVRPGITCLWQIGGRSSIGFDEWMALDMQYIDEWSFWLDLKILARTIPAVIFRRGAA